MAQLIPPFLASAFERLGSGNKILEQIEMNTRATAAAVATGGDLHKKMDDLIKAINSPGKGGGKVSIKEALVLRITAGALQPIGLGLGVIIDALERAPEGKELKLKMEALTNGLLALADVGWSILKFAGMMVLALPLLLLAGVAMLIVVPLIALMVKGLLWATSKLDEKAQAQISMLGDIGKSLLILTVSLVLLALLAEQALKGLLVAGVILLGMGLIVKLLTLMKLDPKGMKDFADSLKSLALGLFGLSLTLILIGFLAEPIMIGLGVAALVILTIGGVFWLMDKMQVDKSIRRGGKALTYAAIAILSVSISLVLSSLILSAIGWEEVAKVMLVVLGVGIVFGIIGGVAGKAIKRGADGLIRAAVAIFLLGLAIMFMKYVMGNFEGDDVVKSFMVLAVIAGVGVVFGLLGLGEKFIKKGSIAMMLAGVSMLVISLGVAAMKSALDGATWEKVGMIGAVIAGVGIAFGIAGAGPIPGFIAAGSIAMAIAGVALVVIGLGVKMFMSGLKEATWEKVGMMGAIITGVGLAFAGAGFLSIPIVLGAAAMALAGAALGVVASGVTELNKLPIADMFSGKGLFGDSGTKTKGFMGIGGGRPMTNMEVMFEAIANSFSLNPLQIVALYATSPALIMAGYALVSIGKGLQEFQKIAAATDLTLLGLNVTLVTTVLANAFGEIGKKFPGGAAGLFSNGSFVSQGITSVMGMGDALTGIAIGMQNMANLKFPVKYDKNGKPIAFETMDSDAPARVALNTATIVNALATTFGEIGKKYPRAKKGFMDVISGSTPTNDVEVGISSVMGMGGALTGIATGFQAMANLRFPIAWDKEGKPTAYAEVKDLADAAIRVASNTKLIVTSLSSTFAEIGKGQTSSWWEGSTNYEKGVSVVSGLGTPLKNLAEGVANMADMKFATGYDKNGKATGWISLSAMKPDEIKARIGTNTQKLIEALTDTFVAIGGGKAKESSWWQGATTFEKGASVVNALAKPYKTLTETVNSVLGFIDKKIDITKLEAIVTGLFSAITSVGTLDNTQFWFGNGRMKAAGETYDSFAGNIKSAVPIIMPIDSVKFKEQIINLISALTSIGGSSDPAVLNGAKLLSYAVGNTYKQMGDALPNIVGNINKFNPLTGKMVSQLIFGKVDEGNALAGYNAQAKMQIALATTYGKAGENFPKISSAINALDITKLTESRKMFEALAVLSKGGAPGDILAAMGESLEDALKNLASMLNTFKETVKEGNDNQTSILDKVGNTITNVGNTLTGNKNTPNNTPTNTPVKFPTTMEVTIDNGSLQALANIVNQ